MIVVWTVDSVTGTGGTIVEPRNGTPNPAAAATKTSVPPKLNLMQLTFIRTLPLEDLVSLLLM